MIEISSEFNDWVKSKNSLTRKFSRFGSDKYRHTFSFDGYRVRIAGIVYTEWSEEFCKAVDNEVLWANLQQ